MTSLRLKTSLFRNWAWLTLTFLIIGSFWYGTRSDNPVSQVIYPPSPTPTPDARVGIGQAVQAGGLDLTVINAWRIARPDQTQDLGIFTVDFAGTSRCSSKSPQKCTFYTANFNLLNASGIRQSASPPPTKYIAGFKLLQLAPTRELIKLSAETGQIYFLLDKNSQEFTLIYQGSGGGPAQIKLQPRLYQQSDAIRNLSTTPQPKREVIDDN